MITSLVPDKQARAVLRACATIEEYGELAELVEGA